jgi:hypothetical protein
MPTDLVKALNKIPKKVQKGIDSWLIVVTQMGSCSWRFVMPMVKALIKIQKRLRVFSGQRLSKGMRLQKIV